MKKLITLLVLSFTINSFTQTYVPDDNFEQALIDLGYDSGPLDDYVTTANINSITSLDISFANITDLTGIENFIALTDLRCANNNITSLNLANNVNLETLHCAANDLTILDLTNNILLENLYCYENQLTSFDVSSCPELVSLNCYGNNLGTLNLSQNALLKFLVCFDSNLNTLDLTNNINLEALNCKDNQLTSLNLSLNTLLTKIDCNSNMLNTINVFNNTFLEELDCSSNTISSLNLITNTNLAKLNCSSNNLFGIIMNNGNNTAISNADFDTTNNTFLLCIEVDDETYSTTNWTNIDIQTNFGNNCHYGETYVPDDNFEQALINLGYDSGTLDDYVITANINAVPALDVSFKSITDLTGIKGFTGLGTLLCNNNAITELDLQYNLVLNMLNCSFNQLTDLYTSTLNLTILNSSNNLLQNIDLSLNTALIQIYLNNNSLSSLNVKNGTNTIITNFNTLNNPYLACIEVDVPIYSTSNWSNIDSHTSFSVDCLYPSIWRNRHWINSAPTITKNAIIDDDYKTYFQASITANNLIIYAGNVLDISSNDYLKVYNDFQNDGEINVAHQASFVQVQDTGVTSGSGNFNVYSETTNLVDENRFTYFSSPTANETLNTFSTWANTAKMWSFDTSIQDWSLESSSKIMLEAEGYIVTGQPDVGQYPFNGETIFTGSFNNGIISIPMHFTSGSSLDDDNTLIGNPYPSAIDAALLLTNNANANAFYFWTHASLLGTSGYVADDYAIWNSSGGIASSSGSPAPTGYIASCQGFFVTSIASDTFTFNNSVRVTTNNDDFRSSNNIGNDKIWLNLTTNDGLFNQILLNFSADGTIDFDVKFDAVRLNSNSSISFYSNGLNQEHFAIQALPIFINENAIPLGFTVTNNTINNLKISIDHLENFVDVDIYLKDNLLNITHNLQISDYEFENTEGTFNNRFELLFSRSALSLEENILNQEGLVVTNLSNSEIKIKTKQGEIISEFKAYDVLGKLIMSSTPNKASFTVQTTINQGTILIVKARLENGTLLNTKFIKL